jgi:poly(A) polymerase
VQQHQARGVTFQLQPADWFEGRATAAVFDALEAAGGAGCARFVGGCVRNAVLGSKVDDVDIATTLEPPAVIAALKAAKLKAVPTGVEHGTVTAVSHHRPFEITTLRRDVETDGRRAVVSFTTDWAEDAGRRDFTLNALYAGRDGVVIDPLGLGLHDARAGRIVFVGDAETRIREDYLRILRFFRFLAWYGTGGPDPTGVAACAALKGGVARLAAERINKELLKLLAATDPREAVRLMAQTGVLAEILPEVAGLGRFEGLVEVAAPDPILRLAALLPGQDAGAEAARRLRLSNAERDRLIAALGVDGPEMGADMPAPAVRRAVYALGAAFADRARLRWGDAPGETGWRRAIAEAEGWSAPRFPISGEDAARAGLPRGPRMGAALREVEAWWVEADFPDRDAALAQLATVAKREIP